LTPDRQSDLLALMEMVAQRLAHSDEQPLAAVPGRAQVQLGRAVTFIEVHLAERLTLPMIARAASVSTRGLARIFKKEIGSSVVQFILRRRTSRACQLLRRTDHTCAEIAFETGFGSVQHFNRIFRRFEGVAPRIWRRRAHLSTYERNHPLPDSKAALQNT
jgi:transcriptional regulator GlxA family with amidase domain